MSLANLLRTILLISCFGVLTGCSGDSPPGGTAINTGSNNSGGSANSTNQDAIDDLDLGGTTWLSNCVEVTSDPENNTGYNNTYEFQFNSSTTQYQITERRYLGANTSCSGNPETLLDADYEIIFDQAVVTTDGLTAWSYTGDLIDPDDILEGWAGGRPGLIYRDGDIFYLN